MDEYTTQELVRWLKDIREDVHRIEQRLTLQEGRFVLTTQYERDLAHSESVRLEAEKRVEKLEAWNGWIVRTVGAMIITALIAMLLVQGGRI